MYEGEFRREAEVNNRGGDRPSRVHGRPDRVALWAVFLGLAAMIAAAASAATAGAAGSGGTATPGVCEDIAFGDRPLQLGDCGDDVKTLNWVLGSKAYATGVGLDEEFGDLTDAAVRTLQRRAGMSENGVVDDPTREELRASMKRRTASWYGPGFWRNETACGKVLKRSTIGVAHKRLPCGTRVTLNKGGRWLRTKVVDRGPYMRGVFWDLTQAAAEALGMEYTEKVRAAVIKTE
jgi:peptidoglycan hydrolase-like protein with peptidoglycan-binding domain